MPPQLIEGNLSAGISTDEAKDRNGLREYSCISGSAEPPVNAIALIEQSVEGAESDVCGTARAHGAKSERFIVPRLTIRANRLNPFLQAIAVARQLRHGQRGKAAVQNLVVGIEALGIEILSAQFACEHHRTVQDRR